MCIYVYIYRYVCGSCSPTQIPYNSSLGMKVIIGLFSTVVNGAEHTYTFMRIYVLHIYIYMYVYVLYMSTKISLHTCTCNIEIERNT